MNSKTISQFTITSTVKLNGKFFNPYCFCNNRACNGVKKAEKGKYNLFIYFVFYIFNFVYLFKFNAS